MSIVVNLRGRGGVDEFSCIDNAMGIDGVFGNAITNVIAKIPARVLINEGDGCSSSSTTDAATITLSEVSSAAFIIRETLAAGVHEIPTRILMSKLGRAVSSDSSGDGSIGGNIGSFATTSWQQFPLWDIQFSDDDVGGRLVGFHGHPSYPLPEGDTFSSVVVPERDGGLTCQLLAPSNRVEQALSIHETLSRHFLDWYEKHGKGGVGGH